MLNKLQLMLKVPLMALFSKAFYLHVLAMRGVGFRYLLILSLVCALPATYKVYEVVELFKSYEVSKLVAQIPPSFISSSGTLSPKSGSADFAVITNSAGIPVMVYNPQGHPLDDELNHVPIELRATELMIRTQNGSSALPWSSIFSTNADFEPYQSAKTLDELLNSSLLTFWPAVALYLFSMLAFNTLLTALICKLMYVLVFRMVLSLSQCLRLMAYANTICAVLLVLQFFVYLPLSFGITLILPLLYGLFFGRELRTLVLRKTEAVLREQRKRQFTGQGGEDNVQAAPQDKDQNGKGGTFVA